MKISVVIPAHNEEKYIKPCLKSIKEYGQDLFEVIVINNASTDQTSEIARGFDGIRVIDEQRKGLPFARNRGINEARGDIVAFVDSDNMITPEWVETIKQEFEEDPKLVCLSGPYKYYDMKNTFQAWWAGFYWRYLAYPTYLIVGYMGNFGNLAAKREALLKIGGINENIKFYGDDTDITKRLHKLGKVKFSKDLYVYSSARRLKNEGVLKMGLKYAINFISIVFSNKPWTLRNDKDIR
jgi:glycosyltransferase involved in cell wall biosynthesis